MAVKVALVYPFFHPANDNSIFRFPPLGLGYIAAALERQGVEVELVDCTFLKPQASHRTRGPCQTAGCGLLLYVLHEKNHA